MLKRFDKDAEKARLRNKFVEKAEYATVLDDSAFTNIMDVFSEGISEVSRYIEYALLEKKWATARNMSSLTTMGELFGRKRERPKSAIGYILVTHSDSEGNNRLDNLGRYFFDIDEESDYDDITKNDDSNYIQRSALVPWTCATNYIIPKGTIFSSASGVQFISVETVRSKSLNQKFSDIKSNEEKYKEFLKSGGWNGIKYVKVPVIQGIEYETQLGVSNGEKFQTFRLDSTSVENASNTISKDYFYVKVEYPNGTVEKWPEINKITLAGPYDKVFESKLSNNGNFLTIKFGNNNAGVIPPVGSKIYLHYLESLGELGNIDSKFQVNSMTLPPNFNMKDPRTGMLSNFLSCTNIASISGGKNIENELNYKLNAPSSYLTSHSTALLSSYEKELVENSPINLLKLRCLPNSSFEISPASNSSDLDSSIIYDEFDIIANSIEVTAIKANGSKLEKDEATEFIRYMTSILADKKGPNDNFSYVEPNYIKLAPMIKAYTYSNLITDNEMKTSITNSILRFYSISQSNFNDSVNSSNIIYAASAVKGVDSVSTTVEALADVSFEYEDLRVMPYSENGKSEKPLLAIPFKFSKVFAQNLYACGFKNYKKGCDYLLKINLKFINSSRDDKSRTFFLYDNRNSNSNLTLQEAKSEFISIYGEPAFNSNITISEDSENVGVTIKMFNEIKDNYYDRQVRVAQFPYLNDITDTDFMKNAKSWTTYPYEIRPYEQDAKGENKLILSSNVDAKLQISPTGDAEIGNYCFKQNTQFIDYVDIVFNENYEDSENLNYASGYFIIPLSYFGFGTLPNFNAEEDDHTEYLKDVSVLLKNYIDLKVYAQPLQEQFTAEDWNDIIFIDDDDIKVEKILRG